MGLLRRSRSHAASRRPRPDRSPELLQALDRYLAAKSISPETRKSLCAGMSGEWPRILRACASGGSVPETDRLLLARMAEEQPDPSDGDHFEYREDLYFNNDEDPSVFDGGVAY